MDEPAQKPSRKRFVVLVSLAAVLFVGGLTGGFLVFKAKDDPAATQEVTTTEEAAVVEEVAEIYEVPMGETPVVAIIEDRGRLGDEPFFATAKNGDYVIVYDKSRLGIIYRPTTGKIVKVGSVSSGSPGVRPQNSNSSGN